jgi:hypothetical protein
MTDEQRAALREAASKATPGPWYHVNAGVVLPKTRTVHGPVPAQRCDYVSTWPGLGTPPDNRIIIPMEGRECAVAPDDMAHIALAHPAAVLSLLDECERMREALETIVRNAYPHIDYSGPGMRGLSTGEVRVDESDLDAARAALGDGT